MIYDENGFKFRDDELQDLYDRCKETLHKYLKDIRDNVSISPLCSSELYVYRGIKKTRRIISINMNKSLKSIEFYYLIFLIYIILFYLTVD